MVWFPVIGGIAKPKILDTLRGMCRRIYSLQSGLVRFPDLSRLEKVL